MATTPAPQPKIPEEVHGIFCGGIEQATAQKVVANLTIAMNAKVKHIHLLFQSAGVMLETECSSTTSSAPYPLKSRCTTLVKSPLLESSPSWGAEQKNH